MYFWNSQTLQAFPMEREVDIEGIAAHVLKEQ